MTATEQPVQLSGGGLASKLLDRLGVSKKPVRRAAVATTAAIVFLWVPLVLLSALEGSLFGTRVAEPLSRDLVPHVRLLIAIPILLGAGRLIDPRASAAAQYLQSSGVVPASERSSYDSALAGLRSAIESAWPDVVLLALAYAVTWSLKPGYGESAFEAAKTSWMWSEHGRETHFSPAGWWYLLVSGPLFQFILFRWVFRFLAWSAFLIRVSRLSLKLSPAHPDQAGGIGYLGIAQQSFAVVFFALATVLAATIADDILLEGATFQASRLEIAGFVGLMVVVLCAPLFAFTPQMVRARERAMRRYGLLGHKLFDVFSDKWTDATPSEKEGNALLQSAEPSATADFSATYDNIQQMRIQPITARGIVLVAIVLLAPFAPLALTQYSVEELLTRLIAALG